MPFFVKNPLLLREKVEIQQKRLGNLEDLSKLLINILQKLIILENIN